MLNHPKLEEFGKAGRKRVENHFSWDAIAEDTIRVYQDAIDSHK
jgi:starch synthase